MKALHNRVRRLENNFNPHDSGARHLVELLLARRKRLAEEEGIPYVEPLPSTLRPRSLIEALTARRDAAEWILKICCRLSLTGGHRLMEASVCPSSPPSSAPNYRFAITTPVWSQRSKPIPDCS